MSDGQWIERGTLDEWHDRSMAQRARIAALEAERGRLRKALEKLASAATPIFTDEAGLVHFDIHPGSVALWDATADARAALAETENQHELD